MDYYNEHDRFAAKWLEGLVIGGQIPQGFVDAKDIQKVRPDELSGFRQCHFFAGIGGWPVALRLAGWPDSREVWSGSCPCQPYSIAGKRQGDADDRNLWPFLRGLIAQRHPATVFGEQVASKAGKVWLYGVRADMEAMGYAFGASDLCAAGINAPHIRQRLYWVAHSKRIGPGIADRSKDLARAEGSATVALPSGREGGEGQERVGSERTLGGSGGSDGVPNDHGSRLEDRGGRGGRGTSKEGDAPGFDGSVNSSAADGMGNTSGVGRSGKLWGGAGEESSFGWPAHDPWESSRPYLWADDTARRIEFGTSPLVAGLPRGVVPSGDLCASYVQNSPEARVNRIRGYGNSIVPQLAAEFVMAFMEAQGWR